jgi:hypothetical protein
MCASPRAQAEERDCAEIVAPEAFPGGRLIVCRNPLLADERARKREDLLAATERDLSRISLAVQRKRGPLRGKAEIGIAVGAVLDKHKVAKHFAVTIGDASLAFRRNPDSIAREARRDGIDVVRTSVPVEAMAAAETVQAYKDLARVECAFRYLKTVDLEIRPVRHWMANRVRAHVFLCMLADHVEWHLRHALAPLLFLDTEIAAARAERPSARPNPRDPQRPRRRPDVTTTASPSWPSPISWITSEPSPGTPSRHRFKTTAPSSSTQPQPVSRRPPSNGSASTPDVSSNRKTQPRKITSDQSLVRSNNENFGLNLALATRLHFGISIGLIRRQGGSAGSEDSIAKDISPLWVIECMSGSRRI